MSEESGIGDCVKCMDTCIVANSVKIKGKEEVITTCVKECVWIPNRPICKECHESFKLGKNYTVGQVVKSEI